MKKVIYLLALVLFISCQNNYGNKEKDGFDSMSIEDMFMESKIPDIKEKSILFALKYGIEKDTVFNIIESYVRIENKQLVSSYFEEEETKETPSKEEIINKLSKDYNISKQKIAKIILDYMRFEKRE